jgi:hypothetical protein
LPKPSQALLLQVTIGRSFPRNNAVLFLVREEHMKFLSRALLAVSVSVASVIQCADVVAGQSEKNLVGTWTIVSNVYFSKSGGKVDAFGSNPLGSAVFASSGHFSLINLRRDLPKFVSNSRMTGTAEENKAVVQGSFAMFGTYTVKENVITMKVEGSTWPNWIGTDQKRAISFPAADKFEWTFVSPGDDANEVLYKRIK